MGNDAAIMPVLDNDIRYAGARYLRPAQIASPAPENPSGMDPLDLRVVVYPDPVETKTAGGIIIIDSEVEKRGMAAVNGTLIAVGSNAFEDMTKRGAVAPEPGARIMFAKYGGILFKGADGREYRVMNDLDIVGILKEAA